MDVGVSGSCSAGDIQHSAGASDKSVKAGLDMIKGIKEKIKNLLVKFNQSFAVA